MWKFAIRRRGFTFISIGKTFQIHCPSKPCRKYKNSKCRFKFGRFFTDKTIISIPLQHTLNQVDKFGILSKRNNILGQVKKYIDNNNLDPNSRSFSNDLSIQEILSSMGITEDYYYYWTLSISTDNDYEIYLKRSTGSRFVNNYNSVLLKAWEANLDIQPAHNYFESLTYMTANFSKHEREVSESLKQAAKEIKNQNLNVRDAMKKIAYSFISSRQVSVQEAVYNVLPELWFRKCSQGISFINTNLPSNRIRIIKSKEEIELLPDKSTDIFKKSIIDRYMDRPLCAKFESLKTVCLAQLTLLQKNFFR